MLAFEEVLYITQVQPDFFQVRLTVLNHLTISAVGTYARALHCVREFVLNYKTPENLVAEMRDVAKEDNMRDMQKRGLEYQNVPHDYMLDVVDTVEQALHDPEYHSRKRFKSVNMRLVEEAEVRTTAEEIKRVIVMPKKNHIAKRKKVGFSTIL